MTATREHSRDRGRSDMNCSASRADMSLRRAEISGSRTPHGAERWRANTALTVPRAMTARNGERWLDRN